jgi:hypothetical protein
MPPATFVETIFVDYEIIEGILFATFLRGAVIDLAAASEVLAARLAISEEKSFPVLVDGRGVKSFTKEARDLLSSDQGRVGVKASAILVSGYLSSTLANFFLKVNVKKTAFPVKTFTDKQKAVEWLKKYK